MGEFAKFFIRLKTIFDPKGLEEAESQIKKTNQQVSNIGASFKKLGAMFLGGAAIWKIVDFAKDSLTAFAQQEAATNKLANAMKTLGVYTPAAVKDMENFANDMQKVTVFADEVTLDVMALLTTFGLYGNKLKEATKASMDLAVGLKIDLSSAAMIVGKAFTGETATLSRYGIKIDENLKASEKFTAVLDQLQKRFGGAAQAEVETYAGRIKLLANQFGELEEKIGVELLPVMEFWLKQLNKGIEILNKFIGVGNQDFKGRELTIEASKKQVNALSKEIALQEKLSLLYGVDEKAKTMYQERIRSLKEEREKYLGVMERERALMAKEIVAPVLPTGLSPAETIEQAKSAKERLLDIDKWYNSASGIETMNYYTWLHDQQIVWTDLDLAEKERLAASAKEIYERTNTGMVNSFTFSLYRMQAQGLQWSKAWDSMWSSTFTGMTSAVKGYMDWTSDAFMRLDTFLKSVFQSILQAFMDMVAQMIARWIMMKMIIGLGGGAIGGATAGVGGVFSKQKGGPIEDTGLFLGHKGEYVLPADVVGAIKRGAEPNFATAGGIGGGVTVNMTQTNTLGGGDGRGVNVIEIMESIRQYTRDGIHEALELSKELLITGTERAGEA